jgi:hypothetical protein
VAAKLLLTRRFCSCRIELSLNANKSEVKVTRKILFSCRRGALNVSIEHMASLDRNQLNMTLADDAPKGVLVECGVDEVGISRNCRGVCCRRILDLTGVSMD